MINSSVLRPLALAGVAFGLAACFSTPGADQIIGTPERTQLQAHFDCQAEQGVDFPNNIQTLPLKSGGTVVSTINGGGLTFAQARTINQCANAKLGNPSTVYRTEVEIVGAEPAVQPVTRAQKPVSSLPGCNEYSAIIQGGVHYCPNQ